MSSKIDHSYNTTDGRLICNILRQKDRRHPINYWELTSSYIHRQSIWWKVRNIQTPGHKYVTSLIRKAPLKQCALDPIPTWLLKDCIDLLAPYITSVFNISLSSGYVPSSFKDAYITPLLKKSGLDETTVGNYRPVSNLSVLSKTLERAVHQQIENYLSEANLLPSHQSAYRKHHCTETALLKVCSDIIYHLEMGDYALLAFLDLSAAFDTVDKRILLERLSRSFGIDDIALKWFQSYLTNRTEYVLFNGIKSSKRVVQFGVPQGSVLGPLLFVLYTSDLEKIAEKHNLDAHFYADDSQMYIFSKPQLADSAQTRLIACLDDFAQWMSANRLKLNPDKTEFMRCATARRLPQLAKEVVTFGNSSILPATTVRNLGVVVDQKLSFQSHVNKTVSSCFYQLRRLKSSVKALPFETAKTLVNSFVISRINYCNSILAGAPQYYSTVEIWDMRLHAHCWVHIASLILRINGFYERNKLYMLLCWSSISNA